MFLLSIAACMIKRPEHVAPMIAAIDHDIIIHTAEDHRRLARLHTNVRTYGTISNRVAKAIRLEGTIRRAP